MPCLTEATHAVLEVAKELGIIEVPEAVQVFDTAGDARGMDREERLEATIAR